MITETITTGYGYTADGTLDTTSGDSIQDSFLMMLMAQLQYQDPLDPMENTEFTAQLAQINTVQQLESANENLVYEQMYLASINNAQSVGFIGKQVMALGNTLYWDGETSPQINYSLGEDATSVAVNIYDANNKLVRTIVPGGQQAGTQALTWDGKTSGGEAVAEGTYTFEVLASDSNGNAVHATSMQTGVVDGVTFEEGIIYVFVQGQKIAVGDILEINSAPIAQATAEPATTTDTQDSTDSALSTTMGVLGSAAVRIAPFLL